MELRVDPAFRAVMRELHTATHILNAAVFLDFDGALVTGAQMSADGTARMDFDLPDGQRSSPGGQPGSGRRCPSGPAGHHDICPVSQARQQYGLIRNQSVAPPPTADGLIRIVEIAGLGPPGVRRYSPGLHRVVAADPRSADRQ